MHHSKSVYFYSHSDEFLFKWKLRNKILQFHHFTTDFLSDLTKDQLAVLHTLMLCNGKSERCINDAVMGHINVSKTIDELRDKKFVYVTSEVETYPMKPKNVFQEPLYADCNTYCLASGIKYQVMRDFVAKYLQDDVGKEFFLSVASKWCLHLYEDTYFLPQFESKCPITLMRLIVESEVERLKLEGMISYANVVSHLHFKKINVVLFFSVWSCFGVYFTFQ